MPKREHTLTVGRYRVIGEYEAVAIDAEGTLGMPSSELGRLELHAAIAVLSEAESINGDEMRCARKAMGLRQPALAALLDVATETVSRWETGAEPTPDSAGRVAVPRAYCPPRWTRATRRQQTIPLALLCTSLPPERLGPSFASYRRVRAGPR